ncbi:MAG: STAS domain-containing protein [Acutalibacteraceae bacterium]
MNITKTVNDKTITLAVSGRIDTLTAVDFEKEIDSAVAQAQELILDMKELEYTSSAGLRVILKAQKMMNNKGKMKLINVSEDVREIFDITGFLDILTIE